MLSSIVASIIAVSPLLVAGCKGNSGTGVNGDDDASSGGDITPTPAPTEHCGPITQSETWTLATSPHLITCDLDIGGDSGPILTIEAGVTIRFVSGTGLYVGEDKPGGLVTSGTEADPVVFTANGTTTPGAWSGIRFYNGAISKSSSLSNATLEYAGGQGLKGALEAVGATVTVDGLEIRDSEEYGFYFQGGAAFGTASSGLSITHSGSYVGRIEPGEAHTVPPITAQGNKVNGIELPGADIVDSTTWTDPGVPFHPTGDLYVQGPSGPVLTLEAGVTLAFDADRGLYIAYNHDPGGLVTRGTANAPVVFTSSGSQDPGFWSGIWFNDETDDASARLAHTRIEYAGGYSTNGALEAHGANITVNDLELLDSEEYGFYFADGAGFGTGSSAVKASGNTTFGGLIDPARASTTPDCLFSSNGIDGIELAGGVVDQSARWTDPGVPFHPASDIYVQGSGGPVLTLGAGLELKFQSDAGLYVAYDGSPGGLVTEGTADNPVVFTSSIENEPGAWSGLRIHEHALDASLSLSHTRISYGGGYAVKGNIEVRGASLKADHLELADSGEYGFYFSDGAGFGNGSNGLVLERNQGYAGFIDAVRAQTIPDLSATGNVIDGIELGGGTIETSAEWVDRGVPYYPVGNLYVEGVSSPVLTLGAGLVLAFATDTGLYVAYDDIAGGLALAGTADAPVTLTSGAQLEPGAWSGVALEDATLDAKTIFDHFIIEYGGGYGLDANVSISNASPTLKNGVLRQSEEWGLCSAGGSPVLTNLTYSSNVSGNNCP